jgi:hypothetical protein
LYNSARTVFELLEGPREDDTYLKIIDAIRNTPLQFEYAQPPLALRSSSSGSAEAPPSSSSVDAHRWVLDRNDRPIVSYDSVAEWTHHFRNKQQLVEELQKRKNYQAWVYDYVRDEPREEYKRNQNKWWLKLDNDQIANILLEIDGKS